MSSPQAYARIAGVLFLFTIFAGGFGEAYVPSKLIVSADATATAKNLHDFNGLFRLGFAAYLIEAVCDVALALIFYLLLRPVREDLALLTVLFGLISTTLFAVAEMFYFAAVLIVGGSPYLKTFSPDQLNTLALLSLKLYTLGAGIFMVFYGTAVALRGFLIFRSGYLPKFLGVLFVLAGFGFIARNFLLVLAPAYASGILLMPMALVALVTCLWLLVKGVDVEKWEARQRERKV